MLHLQLSTIWPVYTPRDHCTVSDAIVLEAPSDKKSRVFTFHTIYLKCFGIHNTEVVADRKRCWQYCAEAMAHKSG